MKSKFYNIDGEDITGSELFRYAYRTLVCKTSAKYKKYVEEETGSNLDNEEAHEDLLIARKVYRSIRTLFSDEDIAEIYNQIC